MEIEDLFIFLGLFMASVPFFGILLGYAGLIYWPILTLAALGIIYLLVRRIFRSDPLIIKRPGLPFIFCILVAVIFFMMMYKGAFSYPWLEDDDPYGYAVDALYIAEEHTTLKEKDVLQKGYLEPDPPGYSVFMAYFYQIWGDMNRTLKFMNVLIISLGIIFAYLFFKGFLGNDYKAFFAAFILAAIPSFLTRFIFATALAVTLFFPAFYAIMKSREDKVWIPVASILVAGILVVHHLVGFVFGLFFLIYLLFNRKLNVFLSGLYGVLLAMAFWIPNLARYGIDGFREHFGFAQTGEGFTRIVGSATRAYSLPDFYSVPSQNLINTSTGWGYVIFGLILASIVLIILAKRYREDYIKVALLWFVLSLIAVNAYRLPFMLMPFRWWTFLAIPVAILCAEMLYYFMLQKQAGMVLLVILLAGVIFTALVPKYHINAHPWMPSRSLSYPGIMEGHLWMKDNLPQGTPVFAFTQAPKAIGFNMYHCTWCKEDLAFEKRFLNVSAQEISRYLNDRDYRYLILDTWYFEHFDQNRTSEKFSEIFGSGLFNPVYSNEGIAILEVLG